MIQYINISLDLTICHKGIFDLRVPKILTVKELLIIVNEAYTLQITIVKPKIRITHNNKILTSLKRLDEDTTIKNGVLLKIESL